MGVSMGVSRGHAPKKYRALLKYMYMCTRKAEAADTRFGPSGF